MAVLPERNGRATGTFLNTAITRKRYPVPFSYRRGNSLHHLLPAEKQLRGIQMCRKDSGVERKRWGHPRIWIEIYRGNWDLYSMHPTLLMRHDTKIRAEFQLCMMKPGIRLDLSAGDTAVSI